MEQPQKPFVYFPSQKKKSKAVKRYERERAAKEERARKAAVDPTFAAELERLTLQNSRPSPWKDTPIESWDTISTLTDGETVSNFSTSTMMAKASVTVDTKLAETVTTVVESTSALDKTPAGGKSSENFAETTKLAAIPGNWEVESNNQWATEQAQKQEPPKTEEQLCQDKLMQAMKEWPWTNQPEKQLTMVWFHPHSAPAVVNHSF